MQLSRRASWETLVDSDHFHIGIRRSGTEHEPSDTTETINAQLCWHGSQTVISLVFTQPSHPYIVHS